MNVDYKVIQTQDQAVLVEWRDESNALQRVIVPKDAMPELTEKELAAGIPFGVSWATMLNEPLASKLANRLHELGFWTYTDAANRVRDFRNAIIEVIAASLLDAARGD